MIGAGGKRRASIRGACLTETSQVLAGGWAPPVSTMREPLARASDFPTRHSKTIDGDSRRFGIFYETRAHHISLLNNPHSPVASFLNANLSNPSGGSAGHALSRY